MIAGNNCELLIAIEGIDGCGKTTQAKMLANALINMGFNVLLLKEPTDGVYGKRIREILRGGSGTPEEIYELFLSDRRENVRKNILPALRQGKIVIVDRYYISTLAYQGASGIEVDRILRDNAEFPKPDLVIILDIPVEKAVERMSSAGKTRDNFESDLNFLRAVRKLYLKIPELLHDVNVLILDGTKSKEELHREILSAVLRVMERKGCLRHVESRSDTRSLGEA